MWRTKYIYTTGCSTSRCNTWQFCGQWLKLCGVILTSSAILVITQAEILCHLTNFVIFVKEALDRHLNNSNCNRMLGFTLSQAWSPITNMFIKVKAGPGRSGTWLRPLTHLSGHQLGAKCSGSVPWHGRTSELVSPTDRLAGHFPDDRGGNGPRNSVLDAIQLPDAVVPREYIIEFLRKLLNGYNQISDQRCVLVWYHFCGQLIKLRWGP